MKQSKPAFSLVEAIILMTIAAIAIAAITPMITRKIANVTDAGVSIGGATHGRYEIFHKEVFKINGIPNPGTYEKIKASSNAKGIIVYERKTDEEYKTLTGTTLPTISLEGYKSAIYEEIKDAIPVFNDKNEIISAKKGSTIYNNGGRYIFEDANIQYREVDSTSYKTLGSNNLLDKNTFRIIEGRLTKYFKNNASTGNRLYKIDSTDNLAYEIPVVQIPWERTYSGEKLTVDKPATIDPTTGKPVGEFRGNGKIKNFRHTDTVTKN